MVNHIAEKIKVGLEWRMIQDRDHKSYQIKIKISGEHSFLLAGALLR